MAKPLLSGIQYKSDETKRKYVKMSHNLIWTIDQILQYRFPDQKLSDKRWGRERERGGGGGVGGSSKSKIFQSNRIE